MSTKRIFIVEDDSIQAHAIGEMLEEKGYEIAGIAHDASTALAEIPHAKADILILDIHLENSTMDGIGLLLAKPALKTMPIVFISAFKDKATLERVYATQPAAFLSKPFKFLDLYAAVEIACGKPQQKQTEKDLEDSQKKSSSQLISIHGNLFIKTLKGYIRIRKEDVYYLEAQRSYTNIYTSEGKFEVSIAMGPFMEKLEALLLIRIHRSYTINSLALEKFDDYTVTVGGITLPISTTYKNNLKEAIKRL